VTAWCRDSARGCCEPWQAVEKAIHGFFNVANQKARFSVGSQAVEKLCFSTAR